MRKHKSELTESERQLLTQLFLRPIKWLLHHPDIEVTITPSLRQELSRAAKTLPQHLSILLSAIKDTPHALASLGEVVHTASLIGEASSTHQSEMLRRVDKLLSIDKARQAKRPSSAAIDGAIARLAGPLLEKHPRYTSHRVARDIRVKLNDELVAQGGQPLLVSAVTKRVARYRRVHPVAGP